MKYFYYVYCNGILGVKANISNFKWVYGSVASLSSFEEYDNCKVKFEINIKPEKQLSKIESIDKRFQSFMWDEKNKKIYYCRKFFKYIDVGYNIHINGSNVTVEIGENYHKFIKNRVMNMHGMYYLLSDVANIVLLANGFLTMYASAAYNLSTKRSVVCLGAPNTGKTFTAIKLCEAYGYSLISEDVVISDGRNMYSCPWTMSYRRYSSNGSDSAGLGKRINKVENYQFFESCELTDVAVLLSGKKKIDNRENIVFNKASILNGYLFNYCSSPIIKILGLFDDSYSIPWQQCADGMLEKIIHNSHSYLVQVEDVTNFADEIEKIGLVK